MKGRRVVGVLALAACAGTVVAFAQQKETDLAKPKVPIVAAVGCASHNAADKTWWLTDATDPVESKVLFTSATELEEAKKKPAGKNRYKLLGTPEFLTKEELLKSGQRAEFTRPEVANATGQLANGVRVQVKGLLITAGNERRINLVSVQKLADTCKR